MKASVLSVSELIINMYILLQHESQFEGHLKKINSLFEIQISRVSSKMLHYFMIISTAVYFIFKNIYMYLHIYKYICI